MSVDPPREREALPKEPEPPPGLLRMQAFLTDVFQREQPVAGDAQLSAACAVHVTGSHAMTAAEQVDVYRHQFWLRHRAALEEDYPGLQHIVGEELFDKFVRAYLTAVPPHTPSLRDLGAEIGAFAESFSEWPANLRELALDMFRYELAWVDVFDGPDPEPLDVEVIQAVPPEAWQTARIRLNRFVARLAVGYPVHRLRYAVRAGEAASLPARAPGGVRVALYRSQNVLHFEELPVEAFTLLSALGEGMPLVPACELVTRDRSEAEVQRIGESIGGWFSAWARRGFIAGIDLATGA